MPDLRHGGPNETDMLVEMGRLRAELAEIRREMAPPGRRRRSTSFRVGHGSAAPFSATQLRDRVGMAMIAAGAIIVLALAWLLYRLLAGTVGGLFDSLMPQPVIRTASATLDLVLALVLR